MKKPTKSIKNVVGYERFSTDKQNENSIDTQQAAINQYSFKHGYTLIHHYVDMAMTGTNTDRPNFQRMLNDAKAGKFDAIIIYDQSRLSRDIADWTIFRKLMHTYGVTVLSVTENLGDFNDPNTFLTESITAVLANHMILQTRQKSRAGIAQKAKNGVFLGGYPPLGYDVEDGRYVINEHEAKAVRLIFNEYASGTSYSAIVDELARLGYKGKRGAAIGKNSLNAILRNERYIGIYTWNKKIVKYMGKWAGGKDNPEVERIEGIIPVIIDIKVWDKVQQRINSRKWNGAYTAKYEYLLTGLIECECCGAAYSGKISTNKKGYTTRYYICGNKRRTRICNAKNVNADELETAIVAKLHEILSTNDFDSMAVEIYKTYQKDKGKGLAAERKELTRIKTKLSNATKAILNGADFSELNDQITQLKTRKAELEELIAMSPELILTPKMIADKLRYDFGLLKSGDTKRLLQSYISKIYVTPDDILIIGGVPLNY
jgi:site-specific DNA recombinase